MTEALLWSGLIASAFALAKVVQSRKGARRRENSAPASAARSGPSDEPSWVNGLNWNVPVSGIRTAEWDRRHRRKPGLWGSP